MMQAILRSTTRAHRTFLTAMAAGAFTVSLGLAAGCQTQDPHQVEHREFDDQPPIQQPQQQAPPPQQPQQPAPAPGEYR